MITTQLYHTLMKQIEQVLPKERITRKRLFAWLMVAMFWGKTPQINRLANKLPGRTQRKSKAEKLRRWMSNRHVRVRKWYKPIAKQLIKQATQGSKGIVLIVDGTRIGNGHQLLMVAIACRRRALPIAWTWCKGVKGHSSAYKQRGLLSYVKGLIPDDCQVQFIGDSEFGSATVLRLLEQWGWLYVLRQKGRYLVQCQPHQPWQRFDSVIEQGNSRVWTPQAIFTKKYAHSTNLLACWSGKNKDPWLLVTNLPTPQLALRLYAKRMWIEEMFADLKRNGFDLEAVRLRSFLALSRLTLVAAYLYVWVFSFGTQTIKRGMRYLVDRSDRRDLSLFRIGYDMLERCLLNEDSISIRLVPYFL